MSNSLIRQRIEVAVVRLLLTQAQLAGFTLYAIDDGEDVIRVKTADRAMKEIFNRDECYIKFRKPEDKQFFWARIILGNDGDDAISDYSTDDGPFDHMMEEVSDTIAQGVITLTKCPEYHPAWKNSAGKGVCINCGTYHA